MKHLKFFILALLPLNLAFAKTSNEDLKTLVNKVSEITGIKYIYPSELKGGIGLSENYELNKENADKSLSYILHENGYTRLPHEKGVMKIVSSRDIRYHATDLVSADRNQVPEIPNNHDYYMMEFQMDNTGLTSEITRSLRPFMSRYGRIIDVKHANKLIVQDTGINLLRMHGLIASMDKKLTKQQQEQWEKDQDFNRKLKLRQAKHCGEGKS